MKIMSLNKLNYEKNFKNQLFKVLKAPIHNVIFKNKY